MMFDFFPYIRAYRDREAYDLNNNPTLYNIAKMYAKYNNNKTSMDDIISGFRQYLFDDYYLDHNVSRETFEKNIIIHFFNRRIEYDTFSFFRLKFNQTLKDILMKYNTLFSMVLKGKDIFNDTSSRISDEKKENTGGYTTDTSGSSNTQNNGTFENTKTETDTKIINSSTVDDKRKSDTPQNRLSDVRGGSYISEYNYDQNTLTGSESENTKGTDTNSHSDTTNSSETGQETNTHNDTDTTTTSEKTTGTSNIIDKYEKMQDFNHIMNMIYSDLEICFLQTD